MKPEVKTAFKSFVPPFLFVLVLWIVKFAEDFFKIELGYYGVFPRSISHLHGIVTTVFIHANYEHLLSNSIPLLILGTALIYFYKEVWKKVFLIVWILGGFWLWLGGRENFHIGASGLVYGLAGFLFFSGIIRRHTGLMAISMLVVFLYGSMVWGIFPLFRDMSYEAHLSGGVAGILCAFLFRNEGPQRKVYEWEDETEDEAEENISSEQSEENDTQINYHYKENEPGKN